ncbi:MAG: phage repressor protein C with HTH and peptisase S24 domain [Paraglaciecola sp.]|jgi:phage repressor protein C with HTH and peptisase S24 domain
MKNFSEHIVNQRFKEVFEELEKLNLIKGKSDIAKKLGTYNHVVNSILKGQRNITVDQLNKLFKLFGIDANYLFGLTPDMFLNGIPGREDFPSMSLGERNMRSGRQNITLVPNRALAGYAIEHHDADFMKELPKFSVPNMEGSLIAFEISGDSMYPTVTNGDVVICEPLERGDTLRDNHVYVIVTDVVVAKRVQQIREESEAVQLRLISDNGTVYKPYEVDISDIRQILKVKCRLTSYAIS